MNAKDSLVIEEIEDELIEEQEKDEGFLFYY
jgi:hypothetical protein